MDKNQSKQFCQTLNQLQSDDNFDTDSGLKHAEFQGMNMSIVPNGKCRLSERFSRVKEVTGIKYPILLACKSKAFWNNLEKQANESFQFENRKKMKSTSSSVSSMDKSSIGGSPLKLDIIADLSLIDDCSIAPTSKPTFLDLGLSHTSARQVLSLYSNCFTTLKDEVVLDANAKLPALIALCDGQNLKSVSCLCLQPVTDKQNNFKGVKITSIMSKPSAEKSVHMKLKPQFGTTEILCQAKYDTITKSDDPSQDDPQSSLRLELEWRRLTGHSVILLHDPPLEAKARVKIQVTSGSTRSQAFGLFQELEILKAIIQGLATTEVNWIGTHEQPLVEGVKDLVEQLKLGSDMEQYSRGETSQDDDFSLGFDYILLEERKDLDFTDQLWKTLQNCTSYTELLEAFNYVVSALRQGDLLPFIHSYNTTGIARMVKDSYQGQLRVVQMYGLEPLEYLAEMGIQKLLHDYIHIFLSNSLASLNQLDFYMKGNITLQEKVERLGRLHNALEVVIVLKQSLRLTQATLSDCVRQMLKFYETNPVDPAHQFNFTVPTDLLSNIIETYSPTEWRMEGIKTIDGVNQQLVYHFSAEQPFDWVRCESKESDTRKSSGDAEESTYFLTILRDSVSILG